MSRIQQTRIKITWFGAIVFALTVFVAIFKNMEELAGYALGGITFIIGGYQASEGFTKAKYIDKYKKPEHEKN